MDKTHEKGDKLSVYEASFILLPSLALEQVPAKVSAIKESITSAGGEVLAGEDPVLIDLAYSMTKVIQTVRHKVDKGYFGWVKFEVSKEGIEEIKKSFDANNVVVRYIIINTVKENTLLHGKMKLQKEVVSRRNLAEGSDEGVEAKESGEELDKSIDDLVIA